jgi:hypothetical protein
VINVVIVAQQGRIGYQALLCAASIRAFQAANAVRVFVGVPKNSRRWENNPEITDADLIAAFKRYDCEITPFDNTDFGSDYPHANKFYAIGSLPPDEPFLFLDSDSVVVSPIRPRHLNLSEPALKSGGPSWPVKADDGRSVGEVWRSLYEFFDIDPAPWRDPELGDDEHRVYPYYNAGIVYYEQAGRFADLWLEMAKRVWLKRPLAIVNQPIKPWLDQIVLPILLAKLGVPAGRDPDPIHKAVVHYHFPFYLQVRHTKAIELFDTLSKEEALTSVLRKDEGFRYFMSDEARTIVREVHEEFWNSGKQGGYKKFLETLRPRVPLMR